MKFNQGVSRTVFYPCITVFAIACWYIGYSQGQSAIPIGYEVIELPECIPAPDERIQT